MSTKEIMIFILGAAVLIIAGIVFLVVYKLRPREIKNDYFQTKWLTLQKMCSDKKLWKQVLLEADDLLDEAMRKKHIRGKNMGERLVRAQRQFSNNDGVWFGHKLCNKVEDDPKIRLKEADIKEALVGIRQGLKDLGALK